MKTLKRSLWLAGLVGIVSPTPAGAQSGTPPIKYVAAVGSAAQFIVYAQGVNASAVNANSKFYVARTGARTSGGATGTIWIAVATSPTTDSAHAARSYSYYLSLDSVRAVSAYFNRETLILDKNALPATSDIQFPGIPASRFVGKSDPEIAAVLDIINNQVFSVVASDTTVADAKVATAKMLSQGYNNTTNPIRGFNANGQVAFVGVPDFSLSSRPYAVQFIGASPVIAAVNKSLTGTGHFGDSGLTNISRFVLAGILDGTFTRTRDLFDNAPKNSLPDIAFVTLLNNPISGAYTVMEQCIPASAEIQSSQDLVAQPNPLNEPGFAPATGTIAGTTGGRVRVLSPDAAIQIANQTTNMDVLTYELAMSFAYTQSQNGNLRYLQVDGVDPFLPTYSGGSLLGANLRANTDDFLFSIESGNYPIWTWLRFITEPPISYNLASFVTTVQGYAGGYPDTGASAAFEVPNDIAVTRSYRNAANQAASALTYQQAITAGLSNNFVETGADAGGAVYTNQAFDDYRNDTGGSLINVKQ